MRFVLIKDIDQQAILCLHRTRQGFIEERTALYNRLRGLISEFGIVLPQKVERLRREIGAHLEHPRKMGFIISIIRKGTILAQCAFSLYCLARKVN